MFFLVHLALNLNKALIDQSKLDREASTSKRVGIGGVVGNIDSGELLRKEKKTKKKKSKGSKRRSSSTSSTSDSSDSSDSSSDSSTTSSSSSSTGLYFLTTPL